MTILFMGGDLSSMTDTGFGSDVDSAAISFTGLAVRSDGGAGETVETEAWTPVQELWFHAVTQTDPGDEPLQFMDGSEIALKMEKVSVGGGVYTFRMMYQSSVGVFTQVGTNFTIPAGGWFYLDIYLKTGADGACAVFYNGSERMAQAAASMTYAPDISSVRFDGDQRSNYGGVVIATENTIGWRLGRLIPLANGANTAWTGDVSSVDETANNDSDYIYSGTADQVETYTVSNYPASFTGYVPRAVAVSARAKRNTTGPQGLQLCLRVDGTDYFSATKTLGLGYTGQEHVWETNPDTGLAWTSAQLVGLQIGVKSIT